MARHDQKPRIKKLFICDPCKLGFCHECIDILRSVYTDKLLCNCKREGHSGEPISNQILDPETGTVHAQGLIVTQDGEVIRHE